MDSLSISLLHCHGIKRFPATTFDFKEKGHVAICASNGTMKSSLARTFQDIQEGREPGDRIYPKRKSRCAITDEAGEPIGGDSILVLNPYQSALEGIDMAGSSARIVASPRLDAKYKAAVGDLTKRLDELLKHLKSASGLAKSAIIPLMLADFGRSTKREYEIINLLDDLDKQGPGGPAALQNVRHKIVFQPAVLDRLADPKFRKSLRAYITKYRRLTARSRYFQAEFTHNNAAAASKKLETLGFFKAEHTVGMRSKHDRKLEVLSTAADLDAEIKSEKLNIMKKIDDEWAAVDSQLETAALQEFRRHLDENRDLLVELDDLGSLRQKLWRSYLSARPDLLADAASKCRLEEPKIKKILADVKKERGDWDAVVAEFNERFGVPFTVSIKDRTDAVLGIDLPNLQFHFGDGRDTVTVTQAKLAEVLSAGEKNAFYILDMLFEVRRRALAKQDTVVIMDDIADSFDYKNKYTIVQYISEIAEVGHFRLVILTHNFDFFRTLLSRRIVDKDHAYVASINAHGTVRLGPAAKVLAPLDGIMSGRTMPKMLIAALPFARNLVQYVHGTRDKNKNVNKEYSTLSDMLHWRDTTEVYTISDALSVLEKVFTNKPFHLKAGSPPLTLFRLLMCEADRIASSSTEPDLYGKIALSIATRILAEKFMIAELRKQGDDPLSGGKHPSTSTLVSMYGKTVGFGAGPPPPAGRKKVTPAPATKATLDKVVLMTPEIIHLNSFMYEPILDMSGRHLSELYSEVKKLGEGECGQ